MKSFADGQSALFQQANKEIEDFNKNLPSDVITLRKLLSNIETEPITTPIFETKGMNKEAQSHLYNKIIDAKKKAINKKIDEIEKSKTSEKQEKENRIRSDREQKLKEVQDFQMRLKKLSWYESLGILKGLGQPDQIKEIDNLKKEYENAKDDFERADIIGQAKAIAAQIKSSANITQKRVLDEYNKADPASKISILLDSNKTQWIPDKQERFKQLVKTEFPASSDALLKIYATYPDTKNEMMRRNLLNIVDNAKKIQDSLPAGQKLTIGVDATESALHAEDPIKQLKNFESYKRYTNSLPDKTEGQQKFDDYVNTSRQLNMLDNEIKLKEPTANTKVQKDELTALKTQRDTLSRDVSGESQYNNALKKQQDIDRNLSNINSQIQKIRNRKDLGAKTKAFEQDRVQLNKLNKIRDEWINQREVVNRDLALAKNDYLEKTSGMPSNRIPESAKKLLAEKQDIEARQKRGYTLGDQLAETQAAISKYKDSQNDKFLNLSKEDQARVQKLQALEKELKDKLEDERKSQANIARIKTPKQEREEKQKTAQTAQNLQTAKGQANEGINSERYYDLMNKLKKQGYDDGQANKIADDVLVNNIPETDAIASNPITETPEVQSESPEYASSSETSEPDYKRELTPSKELQEDLARYQRIRDDFQEAMNKKIGTSGVTREKNIEILKNWDDTIERTKTRLNNAREREGLRVLSEETMSAIKEPSQSPTNAQEDFRRQIEKEKAQEEAKQSQPTYKLPEGTVENLIKKGNEALQQQNKSQSSLLDTLKSEGIDDDKSNEIYSLVKTHGIPEQKARDMVLNKGIQPKEMQEPVKGKTNQQYQDEQKLRDLGYSEDEISNITKRKSEYGIDLLRATSDFNRENNRPEIPIETFENPKKAKPTENTPSPTQPTPQFIIDESKSIEDQIANAENKIQQAKDVIEKIRPNMDMADDAHKEQAQNLINQWQEYIKAGETKLASLRSEKTSEEQRNSQQVAQNNQPENQENV